MTTTTRSELTSRLAGLSQQLAHHEARRDSARSPAKRRGAEAEVARYLDLVADLRAEIAALPVEPESAPAADSRRRNVYAGTCECGRHVAPGAGYLEFDGGWRVFCGACGLSSTVG